MEDKKPQDGADEEVKGFNESELEDIMNEIENLEKEFDAPSSADKAPAPQEASQIDEPVEQVDKMPAPAAAAPASASKVIPMSAPPISSSQGPLAMGLNISGDMSLNLNLQVGEEMVKLYVGDEGLVIELAHGAKFCVPLGPAKKKAS